ncbi:hypothetical protein GGF31_006098 [Allomyces arbusculus]|nr:hypothetical protein GGF31_006098 [Allomyces arbusculus]
MRLVFHQDGLWLWLSHANVVIAGILVVIQAILLFVQALLAFRSARHGPAHAATRTNAGLDRPLPLSELRRALYAVVDACCDILAWFLFVLSWIPWSLSVLYYCLCSVAVFLVDEVPFRVRRGWSMVKAKGVWKPLVCTIVCAGSFYFAESTGFFAALLPSTWFYMSSYGDVRRLEPATPTPSAGTTVQQRFRAATTKRKLAFPMTPSRPGSEAWNARLRAMRSRSDQQRHDPRHDPAVRFAHPAAHAHRRKVRPRTLSDEAHENPFMLREVDGQGQWTGESHPDYHHATGSRVAPEDLRQQQQMGYQHFAHPQHQQLQQGLRPSPQQLEQMVYQQQYEQQQYDEYVDHEYLHQQQQYQRVQQQQQYDALHEPEQPPPPAAAPAEQRRRKLSAPARTNAVAARAAAAVSAAEQRRAKMAKLEIERARRAAAASSSAPSLPEVGLTAAERAARRRSLSQPPERRTPRQQRVYDSAWHEPREASAVPFDENRPIAARGGYWGGEVPFDEQPVGGQQQQQQYDQFGMPFVDEYAAHDDQYFLQQQQQQQEQFGFGRQGISPPAQAQQQQQRQQPTSWSIPADPPAATSRWAAPAAAAKPEPVSHLPKPVAQTKPAAARPARKTWKPVDERTPAVGTRMTAATNAINKAAPAAATTDSPRGNDGFPDYRKHATVFASDPPVLESPAKKFQAVVLQPRKPAPPGRPRGKVGATTATAAKPVTTKSTAKSTTSAAAAKTTTSAARQQQHQQSNNNWWSEPAPVDPDAVPPPGRGIPRTPHVPRQPSHLREVMNLSRASTSPANPTPPDQQANNGWFRPPPQDAWSHNQLDDDLNQYLRPEDLGPAATQFGTGNGNLYAPPPTLGFQSPPRIEDTFHESFFHDDPDHIFGARASYHQAMTPEDDDLPPKGTLQDELVRHEAHSVAHMFGNHGAAAAAEGSGRPGGGGLRSARDVLNKTRVRPGGTGTTARQALGRTAPAARRAAAEVTPAQKHLALAEAESPFAWNMDASVTNIMDASPPIGVKAGFGRR